jgi:hypothetical protein
MEAWLLMRQNRRRRLRQNASHHSNLPTMLHAQDSYSLPWSDFCEDLGQYKVLAHIIRLGKLAVVARNQLSQETVCHRKTLIDCLKWFMLSVDTQIVVSWSC